MAVTQNHYLLGQSSSTTLHRYLFSGDSSPILDKRIDHGDERLGPSSAKAPL